MLFASSEEIEMRQLQDSTHMKTNVLFFFFVGTVFFSACQKSIQIQNGKTELAINGRMYTRLNAVIPGSKPLMSNFSPSEYLVTKKFVLRDFILQKSESLALNGNSGKEMHTLACGLFKKDGYAVEKQLDVFSVDSMPDMLCVKVSYINRGDRMLQVIKWVNHAWAVKSAGDQPAFWSFQGSSTPERKDWILPVDSSFSQRNFMGMNGTDCGGGIPLLDLWRRDAGVAIGHAETQPWMVSLPVEKDRYDDYARIQVEYEFPEPVDFMPGDTLHTLTTFVIAHSGDCFAPLRTYSAYLQTRGIHFAPPEENAYEPVWCAWGYERKFTPTEIIGTLPKVKELGIKWVDIDDGYQQAEGDWDVDRSKFPGGDADMRKLVDRIHSMGMKAKLWWAPFAVDPTARLLRENPDIILINKDGAPQYITWWDSYYMAPSYEKTIRHTQDVLKMFMQKWDYDGLKIDGQYLNCVPPDYNPKHHLNDPFEAYRNLPLFFKMVYETARTYKPDAVIQICPCGDAMSVFNMPWMNQAVASDPVTSWQTRLKGKAYKALLGNTAYYGDHVELSDGGDDFASQIGIGAVPGTKFTWPKDNPYAREHFVLTPEKEKLWKHWLDIYRTRMLPKGTYLGTLYDIGYDKPETHVIQKGDTMYYAFYAPEWNGNITLRGLGKVKYKVFDYANNKDLDSVDGTNPVINVAFKGHLLIEVSPLQN